MEIFFRVDGAWPGYLFSLWLPAEQITQPVVITSPGCKDKGNRRDAENAEGRRDNFLCGPPRSLRLCGYPCLT